MTESSGMTYNGKKTWPQKNSVVNLPNKLIQMPMLTTLPTNYRCYWVII